MACLGCGNLLFWRKKAAFKGLPYDSNTYYASGLADAAVNVRSAFRNALAAGGIQGVQAEPWMIRMKQWFSEKREYVVIRYAGVQAYLLVLPYGKDLYASWISFFNLGCLQRLIRLGRTAPTDLDVDDLEMLGQSIDVYLRSVLDEVLRGAGAEQERIEKVFTGAIRKRFVKA